MKCVVTGVSGQLGHDLIKELENQGYDEVIGLTHEDMDLSNPIEVQKTIINLKPDVVFHCAAYTKVDQAEEESKLCEQVNAIGTKQIAIACRRINAKLIYVSTDYVFDGNKKGEYFEDDLANPQNVYGMTKYQGELYTRINPKTFIVRISWVFGINGKNFIKTMLKLAESYTEVNVVCDQIGSPTYTVDLAKLLVSMAQTEKYGIYHATNEGFCSWADLAEYVFQSNGLDVTVNRIPTSNYPQKAKRPFNSRLSKDKLEANGFQRLPSWQDAVDRFHQELKQEKILKK